MQAASPSPKALWAVIGVLVVALAALGGVLLHRQGGNATPQPVAATTLPAPATGPAPDDFKPEASVAAAAPPPATGGAQALAPPAPLAVPAPRAMAAGPAPNGALAEAAAPPERSTAQPVCAVCGRVESVRIEHRAAPTTGVGAVAGGVVGGVVGNQIGHGNGRAAATVLGAVGGGFLGNTIEKRTRTVTVHVVRVRMDDGSLRTVETRTAPPIGKAVTLRGNVLRPADGRRG